MKLGENMFNIRCKCGHVNDFMAFRLTPIGGELPSGHYQCPKCGKAWSIQMEGKARVGWSGMVIPPQNRVVEEVSAL